MTTPTLTRTAAQDLRLAAGKAVRAPSVHNTQPWHFDLGDDELAIRADWNRKLAVVDPMGRQLLISCGCALFNARVSLAANGRRVNVARFPLDSGGLVVARLKLDESGPLTVIGSLEPTIDLRQTNRRAFASDPVGPEVVETLIRAALAEGAELKPLTHLDQAMAAARLTQRADQEQNADPRYRAELRAWTSGNESQPDGVLTLAVPHVSGYSHDDFPIRDFDTSGDGRLPDETRSTVRQSLFVLATKEDRPLSWLRAGEALERVWLETTRHGYAMSLFTQAVEVPWIRDALRRELRMDTYPHMVIRIGRAGRTPRTRRRKLADVLTET